jgi:hypothetical protein
LAAGGVNSCSLGSVRGTAKRELDESGYEWRCSSVLWCGVSRKKDAMTIDPETQEEINRLDQAVDDFATEMKARLQEQAMKGYRGWDDPENYQRIVEMMVKHAAVAEGEEVDAANLAMILWSLRRRVGGG